MLPDKLPKPSKYAHYNDPETKEEWEEYFRCRQTYDVDYSPEDRAKIVSLLVDLPLDDPGYDKLCRMNPIDPDLALQFKHGTGLNDLQYANLIEAKRKYPDEF